MNKIFISQFRIGRRAAIENRLATAYDLHKLLWRCFPGCPEARRDFLFRYDDSGAELKVAMLSGKAPELAAWAEWDGVKEIEPVFGAGTIFWFRLRANPTVRSGGDGKLRAVTAPEELQLWLQRKGARHGFALRTEPEFSGCRLAQFIKPGKPDAISLNVVDIGGVLAVTDGDAFGKAFAAGIGRSRAFGCGMLLLKRIEI